MASAVLDFKHPVAAASVRPADGSPFEPVRNGRNPGVNADRSGAFGRTNSLYRPSPERRGAVVTMAGLAG